MQILAIVSLLAGGLFYALITAHLNEGHETWAYAVLVVALVSSFVLAIQESVSAIHRERVQVEPDQTSMQQ
jgi:cation transporter-like permease